MDSVLRVTQSQRAEMIGLYHTELGAERIPQEVLRARGNYSFREGSTAMAIFLLRQAGPTVLHPQKHMQWDDLSRRLHIWHEIKHLRSFQVYVT